MANRSGTAAEILIAGGGMVGAALACALADADFRVILVEARPPQREWPPESMSNRVSALTRASERILRRIGVWPAITQMRATPYSSMHVWDRHGFGEIHFDCDEVGEPNLGYIIENRVIQHALWQRLEALPRVEILCPVRIQSLDLATHKVQLDNGVGLTPSLAVAADGARSALRDQAGISVDVRDLGQLAVVATVRVEAGHRQTAWQHFLPTGPLAFLPVDDAGQCSIVWSTTPEEAEHLIALEDSAFCEALTAASDGRLGQVTETTAREAYPLRSQHAQRYVLPGLALVGDAAHVIHPLAGQGVNLGLLDMAQLVDTLIRGRDAGRPIGSLATLRRYERARRGENLAVMRAMEGFNLLFSNRLTPLSLVRNLGLRLTDAATPLKNMLVQRAMGLVGELPPLARVIRDPD